MNSIRRADLSRQGSNPSSIRSVKGYNLNNEMNINGQFAGTYFKPNTKHTLYIAAGADETETNCFYSNSKSNSDCHMHNNPKSTDDCLRRFQQEYEDLMKMRSKIKNVVVQSKSPEKNDKNNEFDCDCFSKESSIQNLTNLNNITEEIVKMGKKLSNSSNVGTAKDTNKINENTYSEYSIKKSHINNFSKEELPCKHSNQNNRSVNKCKDENRNEEEKGGPQNTFCENSMKKNVNNFSNEELSCKNIKQNDRYDNKCKVEKHNEERKKCSQNTVNNTHLQKNKRNNSKQKQPKKDTSTFYKMLDELNNDFTKIRELFTTNTENRSNCNHHRNKDNNRCNEMSAGEDVLFGQVTRHSNYTNSNSVQKLINRGYYDQIAQNDYANHCDHCCNNELESSCTKNQMKYPQEVPEQNADEEFHQFTSTNLKTENMNNIFPVQRSYICQCGEMIYDN